MTERNDLTEALAKWATVSTPERENLAFIDGWHAARSGLPKDEAQGDGAADIAAIRHTLMTGLAHNPAIAALDRLAATSPANGKTSNNQQEATVADHMEAHNTNGIAWAVSRWVAEVANRPLVNVHRRTLDDTWRQVIRYFGGDPDKLIGPDHDTLHMRARVGAATSATNGKTDGGGR